MDVDNDIDSQLLQQFSSIQTNDRDVLIAEFQRVSGDQLSEAGCTFFLDMNNWNLQAAICSYFEYGQPPITKSPQMSFVQDITIGEGESIPPNTKFTKTWRVKNCGDEPWPYGCYLKFVGGNKFGETDCIMAEMLPPDAHTDISVEMVSPAEKGFHQSQWRMCTANGLYFGECIWVILQVDEGGVLGVTQLLSQFECSDFAHRRSTHTSSFDANPFQPHGGLLRACRSPTADAPLPTAADDQDNMATEHNSVAALSSNARYSSLPSSPRWLGDLGRSSPVTLSAESLPPRPVLFQTPDNSPSRTINSSRPGRKSTASDNDSMEMS